MALIGWNTTQQDIGTRDICTMAQMSEYALACKRISDVSLFLHSGFMPLQSLIYCQQFACYEKSFSFQLYAVSESITTDCLRVLLLSNSIVCIYVYK